MKKEDLDSYNEEGDTHEYSEFKTKQMRKNQFDVQDPYEMDDEDEPVSDWIKELMMDDEEWMEMRQNRDMANLEEEEDSNK
jgi:hypothetical protein